MRIRFVGLILVTLTILAISPSLHPQNSTKLAPGASRAIPDLSGTWSPHRPVPVTAESVKPGEYLVTIEDNVEVGVNGRPSVLVPIGTVLKVYEVRGRWIGVRAEINGVPKLGWILAEQVVRQTGTNF